MAETPDQPVPANAESTHFEPVPARAESTQLEDVRSSLETDTIGETLVQPDGVQIRTVDRFASLSNELSGEFGRYRISRLLGKGAMGAVYLADDSQLNRQVALKIPQFTSRSPSNLIDRFYREARSAATLTHPNICPVYDVGEIGGRHFISMGYIDGRPLSDYIESGKKQPEKQVAGAIRKLALALQEAHDKGVVHRDLKPANIMIDRRNEPIVMDFGLAKQMDDQKEAKLTKDGTVVGSPSYMSPEQVGARSDLGPATDIYSLGVVLYELLSGQMPFQGTVISVIGQIVNSDPPSLIELRTDLSPEMEAICLKAMAKSPQDRFASMGEFAQTLRNYIDGDLDSLRMTMDMDAAPAVSAEELQERKAAAAELLKSGQLRKAVNTLEILAEEPGVTSTGVGSWLQKTLPEARLQLEKAVDESKSLVRRAKKSMDSHDYERASQLLHQVPADLANNAVADLKVEARELSEEVESLSIEIEDAMRSGQFSDMWPTVERMLELKPQHRQANDLYEKLSTEIARPTARVKKRRSRGRQKAAKRSAAIFISGGIAVLLLVIGFALGWFDGDEPENQTASTDTQMGSSDQPQSGDDHNARPGDASLGASNEFGPSSNPGDPDQNGLRPNPEFRPGNGRGPGVPLRFEGRGEAPEEMFLRADRNDDEVLDQDEIPRYMIERSDTDTDGRVTYQEFLAEFERQGPSFFRPPADNRGKKLRDDRFRGPGRENGD